MPKSSETLASPPQDSGFLQSRMGSEWLGEVCVWGFCKLQLPGQGTLTW
jgi:hypothetical protein